MHHTCLSSSQRGVTNRTLSNTPRSDGIVFGLFIHPVYINHCIYIYIINGLTPWCRRPPIKGGQGRGRRRFTHTHIEREIYIYLDLPVPSKMWDFWNLQVLKGKTRCLVLRLSRPAQNVPHTSFKAEEKQLVRPREVPWPSKRHAFESCCGGL